MRDIDTKWAAGKRLTTLSSSSSDGPTRPGRPSLVRRPRHIAYRVKSLAGRGEQPSEYSIMVSQAETAYLQLVAIAARRTCRSLSRLRLSRYSRLKSSLNRPLKLLIRLITSFLPRPAIEVAKESKEFLEAIIISLEKGFCQTFLPSVLSIFSRYDF